MSTSNIEKKSLEAHVELCAARYTNLEERFDEIDRRINAIETKLDDRIERVEDMLGQIASKLDAAQNQRNSQLIRWGTSIIAILVTSLAAVLWELLKAQ